MKNYYEILQVNKNASPEVIEKVYKMLVKTYHPDLHPEEKKQFAEQKIKLINEAYDTLSNEEKRKLYDKELGENFVNIEKYNLLINENIKLKNELNNIKLKISNYNNYFSNNLNTNSYQNTSNNNYQEKNNYINYSNKQNYNNLNYKKIYKNFNFREKLMNLLKNLFALFITSIFIVIIFQIPFFKQVLFNLNFENGIFIIPIVAIFIYLMGKK